MNCNDIEIMISAYADGELDEQSIAIVEAHIALCESCRCIYEQTLQLQKNLTDALTPFPESPDFVCAVDAQIHRKNAWRFSWAYAAAAAAILLAVCACIFFQPVSSGKSMQRRPIVAANHKTNHAPVSTKKTVTSAPILHLAKTAPRSFARVAVKKSQSHRRIAIPVKEPAEIANEVKANEDKVEVIIKYTDSMPSSSAIAEVSPQIPAATPGKRVVAENDSYTINGRQLQRMCYKIIDIDPKKTPEERNETN